MPSALASIAAAQTAGYSVTRGQNGAVYHTTLEKFVAGEAGQSHAVLRARGEGVDAATADTQALAALNAERGHRYGTSTGVNSGNHGEALTADQT